MATSEADGLLPSEPQHEQEFSSWRGSNGSGGELGCGLGGCSPNQEGGDGGTARETTAHNTLSGRETAASSPTPPDGGTVAQFPQVDPVLAPTAPRPQDPGFSKGCLPTASSSGAEHARMEDGELLAVEGTGCAAEAAPAPARGPPHGGAQLREGAGMTRGSVARGGKRSAVPNGDGSRGGGRHGSEAAPSAAPEDVPGARRRSASEGAVQENGWGRRGRTSHSECSGLDRRVAVLSSAGSSSSGSTEGPDSPLAEEALGAGVRWSGGGRSVSEVKELAYARLQAELSRAQQELRLRDEEVARLSQIRDQVGAELEELTASLFEEANNMVREANMKQAAADKRLQEATLKVEVLQAEVSALKALVLTSTPSRPNAHLHPQLGHHRHRRSPSNYELATCRPPSPPACQPPTTHHQGPPGVAGAAGSSTDGPDLSEADPVCQREFARWQDGSRAVADRGEPFVARLYREDVLPCLHFPAAQLAAQVLHAIEDNCITIEAVHSANPFPRRCSLLEVPRICQYRMRLGDSGAPWHHISQLCRNRITSVCDLFCYLRYIQQGLVRSSLQEMYWEVVRRRRSIALARLGLPC